jgi:hypothetical protein
LLAEAELGAEPGAGEGPFALDGAGGDLEDLGAFFDREAAEEAELDDTGGAFVGFGEAGEGFVELHDLAAAAGGEDDGLVEGQEVEAAAAFAGDVFAGVVDEDAAHDAGGDGVEVRAVLPVGDLQVDELEVGLVDEGGCLEGVVAFFAAHVAAGDDVKFVVDGRDQPGSGVLVACLEPVKEGSDIIGFGHIRRWGIHYSTTRLDGNTIN